jgi:type IV secretory pathway VirB2 component (pilin)
MAQSISADEINIPNGSGEQVLVIGLNLTYFVAGIIAVIIIIIAGFKIITASEQSKVVEARESILHAIIGIVVILSAFVITQYFLGRF